MIYNMNYHQIFTAIINSDYRGDTPQIKEEPGYYGNGYYDNGYTQPQRYGHAAAACHTPYQYQVCSG